MHAREASTFWLHCISKEEVIILYRDLNSRSNPQHTSFPLFSFIIKKFIVVNFVLPTHFCPRDYILSQYDFPSTPLSNWFHGIKKMIWEIELLYTNFVFFFWAPHKNGPFAEYNGMDIHAVLLIYIYTLMLLLSPPPQAFCPFQSPDLWSCKCLDIRLLLSWDTWLSYIIG